MNERRVISTQFPYLQVEFRIGSYRDSAEGFLDTGFDGYLLVPERLIDSLPEMDDTEEWELADGSVVVTPVYLGELRIGHLDPVAVTIIALGNQYLIGRGIISRYQVLFDHGERIVIEP